MVIILLSNLIEASARHEIYDFGVLWEKELCISLFYYGYMLHFQYQLAHLLNTGKLRLIIHKGNKLYRRVYFRAAISVEIK